MQAEISEKPSGKKKLRPIGMLVHLYQTLP